MIYALGDRIHDCGVLPFQIPADNVKILTPKNEDFLSMGYKKDIFAVFAYEFERLQK